MAKAKKRNPDLRRIRSTKTYRLPEIAEALDRDIATVRRWLRAGLPILDKLGSPLVDGAALRAWLKAQRETRKSKCAPDQLYCLKCRAPRLPELGSFLIQPRNEKTISIKAKCSVCGSRMNKAGAAPRQAEIEDCFRAFMPDMQRLVGCDNTSDKRTKQTAALTSTKTGVGGGQISIDFETVTGGQAPQPPSVSKHHREG